MHQMGANAMDVVVKSIVMRPKQSNPALDLLHRPSLSILDFVGHRILYRSLGAVTGCNQSIQIYSLNLLASYAFFP